MSSCGQHNLKTLWPRLFSNFFKSRMKILEILLLFSVEAQNVRERWKEILWRMNENLNETYEIDARRKGKKGQ